MSKIFVSNNGDNIIIGETSDFPVPCIQSSKYYLNIISGDEPTNILPILQSNQNIYFSNGSWIEFFEGDLSLGSDELQLSGTIITTPNSSALEGGIYIFINGSVDNVNAIVIASKDDSGYYSIYGYGCSIQNTEGTVFFETVPPTWSGWNAFFEGAEQYTPDIPIEPDEPDPIEPLPIDNKCILYQNMSEAICLNKTLVNAKEYELIFKDSVSVQTPIIRLRTNENLSAFNYAFLKAFNRCYFITRCTMLYLGLWELEMRVDVLYTFQPQIRNATALIDRWEGSNELLPDDTMGLEPNVKISVENLRTSGAVLGDSIYEFANQLADMTYILTTTSEISDANYFGELTPPNSFLSTPFFVTPYAIKGTSIGGVFEALWGDDSLRTNLRKLFNNPIDCIFSFKAFPFKYEDVTGTDDPSDEIFMGKYQLKYNIQPSGIETIIYGHHMKSGSRARFCMGFYPFKDVETFQDLPPYKTYMLFAPFYGYIEVDPREFYERQVNLYYSVDWVTGDCTITLERYDGTIVNMVTANIGIDSPLSSNDRIANTIRSVFTSLLPSASSGISSANTASKGGVSAGGSVAAGIGVAALNVASSTIPNALTNTYSQTGGIGGVNGFSLPLTPYMLIKERLPDSQMVDNKPMRNEIIGAPYNKVGVIGEHEGFLTVASCHIAIQRATDSEIAEIENLLHNGIIV